MAIGHLNRDAVVFAAVFASIELCLVITGLALSHLIFEKSLTPKPEALLAAGIFLVLYYCVNSLSGLYLPRRGSRFRSELKTIVSCWVVIISGAGLFLFLTKFGEIVSRLWFGWGVIFAFILCMGFRVVVRASLRYFRSKGFNSREVAVIGSADDLTHIIGEIENNDWSGFRVRKTFDIDQIRSAGRDSQNLARYISDCLTKYVEEQRSSGQPINQVWISLPLAEEVLISQLMDELGATTVDVKYVPNALGNKLIRGSHETVADIGLINVSSVNNSRFSSVEKVIFDKFVCVIALVLLSPIVLLIPLLIKLDSAGPILFRQKRYGIDGKEIVVYKFRTMYCDEYDNKVVQATRSDPRITTIGRFLRRTSLDELPQLFNVLKGDMSIVGPRPHAVAHNEEYRQKISGYMQRHKIKPGITGWAQVNGWRGETDTLVKMQRRVDHDIEYIQNWSIGLDVKILLMTVFNGFVNKNAY